VPLIVNYFIKKLDYEPVTIGSIGRVLQERIDINQYPRLFFMTNTVDILPSKNPIVQKKYKFNNLDFRDKITGIPLQYDVYVQIVRVKETRPYCFFSSEEVTVDHYIISEIVENNILSNDPSTRGVKFYFKVNGTAQLVIVQYDLFTDILGALGSFYSIFDLVGRILSYLYADYFYEAELLNSVFKFNEDKIDRIRKLHKNSIGSSNSSKSDDESNNTDNNINNKINRNNDRNKDNNQDNNKDNNDDNNLIQGILLSYNNDNNRSNKIDNDSLHLKENHLHNLNNIINIEMKGKSPSVNTSKIHLNLYYLL